MVSIKTETKYFCDLTGKPLLMCPEYDMEKAYKNCTELENDEDRVGAVIEFNSSYLGICDDEQSEYVIPHWLAVEFLHRIKDIQKKLNHKQLKTENKTNK